MELNLEECTMLQEVIDVFNAHEVSPHIAMTILNVAEVSVIKSWLGTSVGEHYKRQLREFHRTLDLEVKQMLNPDETEVVQ
jgi:hypothetical protein